MRTEAKACFARNAPARVGNILSTVNIGQTRTTTQSYSYDDRYQLTGAEGLATATLGSVELWRNSYQQSYRYDRIGNMTGKTSSNQISPSAVQPGHLNYDLAYTYDADRPHQATRIGELAYRYDANGNLTHVFIPTAEDPNGEAIDPPTVTLNGNRGSAPEALGRFSWDTAEEPEYVARYQWNEENRMVQSITGDDVVTTYRYDASGIRSAKYSDLYGETIYADRMYQEHFGPNPPSLVTKHIFVGQSRIASKLHYTDQTGATRALFMQQNTYWYHADHLGSTNWVTDYQGEGYEHFAYTPYGESWVSENLNNDLFSMTHRFTGQELDPETGLYAFPARNYDPRTSRWLSVDPALAEYLPVASTSDQAREYNANLPGLGGVFNYFNLAVYHYGGNNPLVYVDPDGRQVARALARRVPGVNAIILLGDLWNRQQLINEYLDAGGTMDSYLEIEATGFMGEIITDEDIEAAIAVLSEQNSDAGSSDAEAGEGTGSSAGSGSGSGSDDDDNNRRANPSRSESEVWRNLDRHRGSTRRSGSGRNTRYYEWDNTHNDIEVYDRRGNHLGSMDPTTGEMYKPPVRGRTITP